MGGWKIIILGLLLVILSSSTGWGEEEALNLQFILEANLLEQAIKKPEVKKETSELKLFFIAAIRFYQIFISPQDIPICNFIPSCSCFGLEAVKRYGALKGILLISDRLQRCHSCGIQYYQLDEETKRAKDPLKDYIFD